MSVRQSLFDILRNTAGSTSPNLFNPPPPRFPIPPLPGDDYRGGIYATNPELLEPYQRPGYVPPPTTTNPRDTRYEVERDRTGGGAREVATRDKQWHDIMGVPEGFMGNVGNVPTRRGQRFGPFGAL